MNIRKHMTLVVGGAICLLLFVVAVVFLFKFRGEYGQERSELKSALQKLDRLNRREPFPSQSNLEREADNLEVLKSYFANLRASLSSGEVTVETLEPAQFPSTLEQSIRRMVRVALDNNVKLADRFSFGFSKYAEGALPRGKDMERLVLQLKTTEQLADLLFNAKIDSLDVCEREEFEDQQEVAQPEVVARGRTRPGRISTPSVVAGEEEGDGLYTRERYVFDFSASEQAFWRVMNVLGSSDLFVAASEVTVRTVASKEKKQESIETGGVGEVRLGTPLLGRSPTSAKGQSADAEYAKRSHDERVVAGREILNVRIKVDVYRFKRSDEKGGEA
ncbi:MAG: Amuc_1100 family pilus-like protein [Verrucomicrobia bacterium]|nr:Amuc_1100 family pilus-like protein [Verrucomicrobiota bacterium]